MSDTAAGLQAKAAAVGHPGHALALSPAQVIVVSHGFQPNYERGFSNGLAASGAQVVLVGSDRTDARTLAPSVRLINLRGSQESARSSLSKALNLLRYHLRLMAMVLGQRGRIVHVIGLLEPVLGVGVLQGLWFRLFARRYVLTVHNIVPHDRDSAFNRWAYRITYSLAHALVVHTPAMAHELSQRFGLRAEKISVMEHGIEPLSDEDTEVAGVRTGEPLQLLFFGVVLPYKGLDVLLDALREDVPAFRLTIVGLCVDAALVRDLERRIAEHPHRDAIRWTRRFVDESEVPPLLRAADVMMLPYRHIDQSGVLFQALRYGLPLIATDVGSFRHYVTEDRGIVCAPGEPAALVRALREFDVDRARFSKRRIRESARRYEWPRVTRALARPYMLSGGR